MRVSSLISNNRLNPSGRGELLCSATWKDRGSGGGVSGQGIASVHRECGDMDRSEVRLGEECAQCRCGGDFGVFMPGASWDGRAEGDGSVRRNIRPKRRRCARELQCGCRVPPSSPFVLQVNPCQCKAMFSERSSGSRSFSVPDIKYNGKGGCMSLYTEYTKFGLLFTWDAISLLITS